MEMVKICGLIAIILTCTAAGLLKSHLLSKRSLELQTILSALSFISTEIRYYALPTATIMEKLDGNTEYKKLRFFGLCKQNLQNTPDFQVAWRSALVQAKPYLAMSKEDIEALKAFGDLFGSTDTDGQLANCARYCELFRQRLADALEDQKKRGRLYSSLGVLSGVFLALVLY
jgi:stage III sporulation protein AB